MFLLNTKQSILNKRIWFIPIFFLLAFAQKGISQDKKPTFTDIKVSGYVRNYMTFRNMPNHYADGPLTPKTFLINGLYKDPADATQTTGYREPLLMILLSGKPTSNTSFDVDFIFDNQMTGELINADNAAYPKNPHSINDVNSKFGYPRRAQSYRWLNLGGSAFTKYGQLDIKVGGVLFVNMAPSIMSNYVYRDDMFERYPWEWQTISYKRYQSFYNDQSIATDSRFGSGSIQGILLTGTQLPARLGFMVGYGKTNSSGGFQSFTLGNNNNQDMLAIQINKKIASHVATINMYDARAVLDTGVSYDRSYKNVSLQQIYSGELKLNFKGLRVTSEFGTGRVMNPIDSISNWDPLLSIKTSLGKEISPLPISLQYYYVGANIVNLNSSILNSSNRNVQSEFGNALIYNNNIFEGAVVEYGQLVNNRMGLNLSTGVDIAKKLKLTLALSSQQEIENLFDTISYQHRLNGFTRSQFQYYRNGTGPYGRHMNTWRRSWEKIAITDSVSDYKKGFNLIDFSTKYQMNLFGRPLILSNYINYNSVQDKFAPIALFNSKAFLRNFYEEFMTFYNIHNKVTIVTSLGVERTWANNRTTLAANKEPIDQTGYGFGLGLDFDINATTGLYLRQKWYSFSDKNFTEDQFNGYDTNLELKIFF